MTGKLRHTAIVEVKSDDIMINNNITQTIQQVNILCILIHSS